MLQWPTKIIKSSYLCDIFLVWTFLFLLVFAVHYLLTFKIAKPFCRIMITQCRPFASRISENVIWTWSYLLASVSCISSSNFFSFPGWQSMVKSSNILTLKSNDGEYPPFLLEVWVMYLLFSKGVDSGNLWANKWICNSFGLETASLTWTKGELDTSFVFFPFFSLYR